MGMTSKEALIKLVDKTGIINDTCASLEDCIKGCKCRFNEPKKECDDYNLVMTIKKDLKRLETLEKEYNNLKKGIKIFLKYYRIYLYDEDDLGSCEIGVDTIGEEFYISKKEYELLKGVFENDNK